jgi:hypothetical protein
VLKPSGQNPPSACVPRWQHAMTGGRQAVAMRFKRGGRRKARLRQPAVPAAPACASL